MSPRARKTLFAALYFSEGAPIGYIWFALPTKLREAGIEVDAIASVTAAVGLPWALKPLLAPLVDALRGRRWGLRSWIVLCQIGMGATLLPLVLGGAQPAPAIAGLGGLTALLVAHAVLAALQDVSIDALAVSTTPSAERGALNGWMQAGLLSGRAIFGGGLLLVERRIGPAGALAVLVLAIWTTTLLLLVLWPRPTAASAGAAAPRLGARLRYLARVLGSAFARPSGWTALAYAAVAGAAYEGVGALAGPFLLDHGLDRDRVAWVSLVGMPLSLSAGALLGGRLADRFGKRRMAALAQGAIAATTLALGALADAGAPPEVARALLVTLYVLIGLFTVSTYALFMDLTDPRVAATHFGIFMGLTNVCESWSAWVAGALASRHGYGIAFAVLAAVSLASIGMLRRIDERRG